MPAQIGQVVNVDGRLGTVVNIADKAQVKFSDGAIQFYDKIDAYLVDTRLKSCPYCKEAAQEVKDDHTEQIDKVYQCMKCSQRFISEDSTKSISVCSN